ncbi:MAG: RdgB/HAM1 family non-canonical purine NTP pyrophosphatase [Patescibacteria group bacterium]
MANLVFATGNKGKLLEAKEILGIDVKGTNLEIDEIQSLDPVEVAVKKAKAYYAKLKKPLFVEDFSFFFKSLSNLPGTYIDGFLKSLGNEGLILLLKNRKDKTAIGQATVVYMDRKGKEHVFIGRVKGKITDKPKGDKGFGWDPIFIPDGSVKTFGQMEMKEKNKYSMRKKALLKLKKWLALKA